uniref:PH domain-containing protein n=1 Tax=viral metagenome TaxID=1070528 RepID=A0A6H1ZQ71_9ZZZZ
MDDREKDLWVDVFTAIISTPEMINMSNEDIAADATDAVKRFREACLLDVT